MYTNMCMYVYDNMYVCVCVYIYIYIYTCSAGRRVGGAPRRLAAPRGPAECSRANYNNT